MAELRNRNLPGPVVSGSAAFRQNPWEKMRRRSTLSEPDRESDSSPQDQTKHPTMLREYTWRVTLREFQSVQEAWIANEVLNDAGIESRLEVPANAMDLTSPRVQVPADQQERAAAVLAKPIPQEIREAAAGRVEDFEPPKCPRCRAEDPLLEAADHTNRWSCEACGWVWEDDLPAS